jgi:hypothetical protein
VKKWRQDSDRIVPVLWCASRSLVRYTESGIFDDDDDDDDDEGRTRDDLGSFAPPSIGEF